MATTNTYEVEIPTTGTFLFPDNATPDTVVLKSAGAVTLTGNLNYYTDSPPDGTVCRLVCAVVGGIDLNGFEFQFQGYIIPQKVLSRGQFSIVATAISNPVASGNPAEFFSWEVAYDTTISQFIDGASIDNASIPLTAIENLTRGSIIRGNSSNRPTAYAIGTSGYVLKSDGTDAAWGPIVNANIDAAAAIARTKIANGTANYVLINSAGGVMTEEQFLSQSRGGFGVSVAAASGIVRVSAGTFSFLSAVTPALGGTGIDTSGSTGFTTIAAGTWSAGALTDSIVVPVSWEAGEQCNNRVQFNFPCTVTNIYAVVTRALANTDAGTIVPKDAGGTNMTLTTPLSFPLSSALETAIDTTVTGNNTVAAGDEIYLTTAKATAGGKALVTITFTRATRS